MHITFSLIFSKFMTDLDTKGGLLAAAIANMEGIGGKAGACGFTPSTRCIYDSHAAWQWIFILEGLATIVIAFASFWAIEDFPISARFLSDEESAYIIVNVSDCRPYIQRSLKGDS